MLSVDREEYNMLLDIYEAAASHAETLAPSRYAYRHTEEINEFWNTRIKLDDILDKYEDWRRKYA